MKKVLHTALGILTSVGYRLLWVLLLGTVAAISLTEMSGRFAAASQRAFGDALRERLGLPVFAIVLLGLGVTSLLVLGAEITGLAIALELATGVSFPWWGLLAGFLVWLILWKGKFGLIEYGVSTLGLVTLAFVASAVRLHPAAGELAAGLAPTWPSAQPARYGFLAVSILGATITPYLFYFYSSGAIEDRWDTRHIGTNRAVAAVGMGFGGALSAAVLVTAALALPGTRVEQYSQLPQVLSHVFGRAGFWLFVVSLWIGCLGAALEVTLALAYLLAQGLGWRWGEDLRPREAARFVLGYSVIVVAGTAFAVVGVDALALTNLAMALSSAVLPLALCPLFLLMNDRRFLGRHRNGWLANGAMLVIVAMALLLSVVSIPLAIMGS
jgi:Mn2+/Fe2+ NRAMP family transporter